MKFPHKLEGANDIQVEFIDESVLVCPNCKAKMNYLSEECIECGSEMDHEDDSYILTVPKANCSNCGDDLLLTSDMKSRNSEDLNRYHCQFYLSTLFVEFDGLSRPHKIYSSETRNRLDWRNLDDDYKFVNYKRNDIKFSEWIELVGKLLSLEAKQIERRFDCLKPEYFNIFLLSDENNFPIGYISWNSPNDIPTIGQMYLLPEFRGEGVGKILLSEWCNRNVDQDYQIESPNEHMMSLIAEIGHTEEGESDYTAYYRSG